MEGLNMNRFLDALAVIVSKRTGTEVTVKEVQDEKE